MSFTTHAAANGFNFSVDDRFGFPGDAFVACFGDAAPVTTRRIVPAGFKVARIDVAHRQVVVRPLPPLSRSTRRSTAGARRGG